MEGGAMELWFASWLAMKFKLQVQASKLPETAEEDGELIWYEILHGS